MVSFYRFYAMIALITQRLFQNYRLSSICVLSLIGKEMLLDSDVGHLAHSFPSRIAFCVTDFYRLANDASFLLFFLCAHYYLHSNWDHIQCHVYSSQLFCSTIQWHLPRMYVSQFHIELIIDYDDQLLCDPEMV